MQCFLSPLCQQPLELPKSSLLLPWCPVSSGFTTCRQNIASIRMRLLCIHGDEGADGVVMSSTLKFLAMIIMSGSTRGAPSNSVSHSWARMQQNGNMLLSFLPFAVLQNHLNHDRKYLPGKISLVDITRRRGADAAQREAVVLVSKQDVSQKQRPMVGFLTQHQNLARSLVGYIVFSNM